MKFATRDGWSGALVWATSWGVSTRLMGALIMTHSDDAGLVLPPKLAPIEVVLVPIYKGAEQMAEIVGALQGIADELQAAGFRVKLDDDDSKRSGWKFAEYELKGVPVRLAMGPRDLAGGTDGSGPPRQPNQRNRSNGGHQGSCEGIVGGDPEFVV